MEEYRQKKKDKNMTMWQWKKKYIISDRWKKRIYFA